MNPRIKLLAEQCTTSQQFDVNKFALLIVGECVDVVENLSPGYNDYRDQIEDAFRRDCMEEMKTHFGIDHEQKN